MQQPIDPSTAEHRQLTSRATGELYSRSSALSERLGLEALFVYHDIVPPGRAMSAAHAHSHREEMVVVLAGEVMAVTESGTLARISHQTLSDAPGGSSDFAVARTGSR